MNTSESTRSKDALELRAARFKDVNPLPTTAENINAWKDKNSALKLKYGAKQLRCLNQRQMYWLSVDQILPRPSPFRARYDIDWTWVDSQKLFTESYMQAFLWRSTHGKLYGRSDLYRFGYTQDETCDNCNHPRQTTEHLFLQCPPVLSLITQFEEHLGLSVKLTETEKRIGLDNNSDRAHIINKKINVLRKCIYDAAHARVIPRWEQVVKNIDRLYVLEYAIGEKSGRVHKVLKEWDL
jgi:hypothetical protein